MPKLIKKLSSFCFLLFLIIGSFVFSADKNLINAQTPSLTDSDIPVILSRSVWNNSAELNSLLAWLPQNETFPSDWQPVERIVVHDTATPNSDPLSAIQRIQSIFRFHAVSSGWGDIGYNYLIDREGKIYEGRYGGNGSRGAHAFNSKTNQNFNYGSIGISLIGEYKYDSVPAVMVESLSRLIGWLATVNNFDPQTLQKTFSIWDSSTKNFSSVFTGPVIVGHKDIDTAKSDPATLDFAKVRQLATQYKQQYAGLVYQVAGSPKIYQIINGNRIIFDTITDFSAKGGSYQKIATISQGQLNLFSEDRFLRYPNGSLLQTVGSPSVYIIDGGKKRNLTVTAQQFTKLGLSWDQIKKVTTGDLSLYLDGPNVIYGPDKSLIKDPQGKVYFIDNGRKRWVTSGGLFKTLGYQWKNVKDKSADYLVSVLDGPVMAYPSGTLVKGSGATVYLIDNGQKREFLSSQSFEKLGYKSAKILKIDDNELALYPAGIFIPYKDGTILRAQENPTVYLIFAGKKQAFISADQFLKSGNQWKNILIIPSSELARYDLAGDVKYPDGTLIQKVNDINIYLIESGLPKLIPDAATFKKLKLSWSKVLKIPAADFDRLYGLSLLSVPPPAPTPSPLSPPAPTPPPSPSSGQPNIRVGIWQVPASQNEIVFSGSGAYDVYDKNGNLVAAKQAGENYKVTNSNSAFAKLVPKAGTILKIDSYSDPAWNNVTNYNQFRGNLELIYSNKANLLWVVNELPLEEYLKGVAETNQGLATEYLKTMAVAARTYAYNYQKQGGKYGADEVYQITNTTKDQLYKGYGREQYASDIVSAATATFGEIVTYNGQPTVTAYSSGAPELITSGSKSACSVWGGKYCQSGFEYLAGGVKDPAGTSYGYDSCGSGNHCVGLSGAGTRQLAALGKTYKEILIHYYPGTAIQKLY